MDIDHRRPQLAGQQYQLCCQLGFRPRDHPNGLDLQESRHDQSWLGVSQDTGFLAGMDRRHHLVDAFVLRHLPWDQSIHALRLGRHDPDLGYARGLCGRTAIGQPGNCP